MWFIPFSFKDFVDIILVATLLFWLYRYTKGTNAPYILAAVVVVYFSWVVVQGLNMELLSNILGQLIAIGAIALIVIFQPEIRRFIQLLRFRKPKFKFINRIFRTKSQQSEKYARLLVDAVKTISTAHSGAILVLSQQSDISLITEGGVEIDAKLSNDLLLTLLCAESKLQHGAVIIDGGRIAAARCVLPLSHSEVSHSCTVRQRAALGLSEISDAVIIVVDAFDGGVSIANAGLLRSGIDIENLLGIVREYIGIYSEAE